MTGSVPDPGATMSNKVSAIKDLSARWPGRQTIHRQIQSKIINASEAIFLELSRNTEEAWAFQVEGTA